VEAWIHERQGWPGASREALFLSERGVRLTSRAVDLMLRQVGEAARVDLSAHVLGHTFCTELVRRGHDLVLVAELAGHRRLETTRRYSLPTAAHRQAAVDSLAVEY
jgi:site-specific recombinase XerD